MNAVNVVHPASCWWQCCMQTQTGLPAPLVLAESVTSGKNCSRNPGCTGHRYVSQDQPQYEQHPHRQKGGGAPESKHSSLDAGMRMWRAHHGYDTTSDSVVIPAQDQRSFLLHDKANGKLTNRQEDDAGTLASRARSRQITRTVHRH